MKKATLTKRILATVLVIVTIFSVSTSTLAYAAKKEDAKAAASYLTDEPDGSLIPEAGYAAGLALIRQFVPGGGAIAAVLDTIVSGFRDNGPTLSDLSYQISQLRSEISTQFADVKSQMKFYSEEIENKIVDQTVIAGKGTGFDKLMTALQGTDRQIKAIMDDSTISENEKAVEVAALIGKNSEWIKLNNLYFAYRDFMNTMASSSFASQKDRDLYQVVYDDFTHQVMFSGEAQDMSRPYVERVMLLGLYAYSINVQCLKAAQTVSKFTPEEVAALNEDEQVNYRATKSLTSVVNAEIIDMHECMFDLNTVNSVASHLKKYTEINRLTFLKNATTSRNLSKIMRVASLSTVRDDGAFYDIYNLMNSGALSHDDFTALANHVRATYPGKSLRTFLTEMGFDMTSAPANTLVSLGSENAYNVEGFFYSGGIAMRYYYNFPSVSIDDTSVSVANRDCFKRVFLPQSYNYAEVLSNANVLNFKNA